MRYWKSAPESRVGGTVLVVIRLSKIFRSDLERVKHPAGDLAPSRFAEQAAGEA